MKKTKPDPTQPDYELTLGDHTYSLCFDFGSLAEAESKFLRQGHNVNLLAALPELNLSSTRLLFAASLHKFHPEVKYEDAVAMVTLANVFSIAEAIANTWTKSLPQSPQVPVEAK